VELMRVLYYLFFPSGFSGIARYTHEVLTRMCRLDGVEPELACAPSYHWRGQAPYRVWPGLHELAHPWPLRRRFRFAMAQFDSPKRLIERAVSSRPAVIHFSNITHLTYPMWKAALARTGARVVATVHDVYRERSIIHTRYENGQLRRFYRSADALLVHGREQATQLEGLGVHRDRIHIVPHGPYGFGTASGDVAAIRRRFAIPEDKQAALFFGTVRPNKNLDVLLEALVGHESSVHLVVAGEIPERHGRNAAFYSGMIQRFGLERYVTVINRRIQDQEAADLFTACDWVALPYGRSFSSQSGVLNVAAEYAKPVLVSATGAMGEVAGRYGIGVAVEPDCVESLRRGIAEMAAQINAGRVWRFQGYRRDFSWEMNAVRTLDVYRAITGTVMSGRVEAAEAVACA
jgi:glycosyltransferase involved in cell wall biosynthesis